MIDWNVINTIATVVTMVVLIVSAFYVRAELKALEKDRYLTITNQLFAIWESKEFMDAQLWLLHRLQETTWQDFVKAHRGDTGEASFHQVGSFYDRVGALVRLGFVKQDEILTTIGAYAIAVWQKVQPLVYEARGIEHSTLFLDFERLLPSCYDCYVPGQGQNSQVPPFSLPPVEEKIVLQPPRLSITDLQKRFERKDSVIPLDVRPSAQVARNPQMLPGALLLPLVDLPKRRHLLPADRELVAYCA